MLLCPACMVELKLAERQGIEIDYCPQCRGVWLDRGELDKILDRILMTAGSRGRDEDTRFFDRDRAERFFEREHDEERYTRRGHRRMLDAAMARPDG
jgi:Zn-finger nucleic acid-binding protein